MMRQDPNVHSRNGIRTEPDRRHTCAPTGPAHAIRPTNHGRRPAGSRGVTKSVTTTGRQHPARSAPAPFTPIRRQQYYTLTPLFARACPCLVSPSPSVTSPTSIRPAPVRP
jgi:hypothetical protein